jgi:release factor glutamine methyltransferase
LTTISDLRAAGRSLLKEAGIAGYEIEADALLMHVLDIDKNTLLTNLDRFADYTHADEFSRLIGARSSSVPIQYITGKCDFMSLEFVVDENVLIPRPDTEILVETILEQEEAGPVNGFEIGLGSGCVSISLEYHGTNMTMQGADISEAAVQMTALNWKRIFKGSILHRDKFFVSDLFQNVPRGTLFDFIVSNPPYIETEEIEGLDSCVKDYEPKIALDGGADGLEFYRRIAEQAGEYLKDKGRIYFEIGYNQARAVKEILAFAGYVDIVILNDYAGKNRVAMARRA